MDMATVVTVLNSTRQVCEQAYVLLINGIPSNQTQALLTADAQCGSSNPIVQVRTPTTISLHETNLSGGGRSI
jgi:hypothetical protein